MKPSLLLHCVFECDFSCLIRDSRGLEFHKQLKPNSFVFKTDENGHKYATLSHGTKQKKWQGGIDPADGPKEKRMYSIPD